MKQGVLLLCNQYRWSLPISRIIACHMDPDSRQTGISVESDQRCGPDQVITVCNQIRQSHNTLFRLS